jgi:ribosome-associated translation inhibitor RaiA
MQTPIHVSFHGLEHSDAFEAACSRAARKLERFARDITSCCVVVSRSQHRHRQGDLHELRITLRVPGRVLAVNRVAPVHASNEELALALREAFDSLRRRLQDHVRVRRGAVKAHIFRPRRRPRRSAASRS